MAEIVDFGLQKHKIKMDSRYFDNVLSVVAGDTGRRLEVQLLDTNGMVQNTTGLNLRLNALVAGKATFTDATLVDAATGKYQLDLSNGMFLAPGNWQFQWLITDSAGKKLHSFAFTGNVGKNISEGGSQATNFYLNLEDLKKMQDDLINGTIDSSILETTITEKLTELETQYAPKLTNVTAQLAQTDASGGKPIGHSVWLEMEQREVNVKWFGAKGDYYLSDGSVNPSPTDNTQAIKNAIAYCLVNKYNLFFPTGSYLVTATVDGISNIIIRGEGINNTEIIKKNGVANNRGVDAVVDFHNKNNFKFSDMRLIGNRTPFAQGNTATTVGLYVEGCSYFTVENVKGMDGKNGIASITNWCATFIRCVGQRCQGYAFRIERSSTSQVWIQPTAWGTGGNFDISDSTYLTIISPSCDHSDAGGRTDDPFLPQGSGGNYQNPAYIFKISATNVTIISPGTENSYSKYIYSEGGQVTLLNPYVWKLENHAPVYSFIELRGVGRNNLHITNPDFRDVKNMVPSTYQIRGIFVESPSNQKIDTNKAIIMDESFGLYKYVNLQGIIFLGRKPLIPNPDFLYRFAPTDSPFRPFNKGTFTDGQQAVEFNGKTHQIKFDKGTSTAPPSGTFNMKYRMPLHTLNSNARLLFDLKGSYITGGYLMPTLQIRKGVDLTDDGTLVKEFVLSGNSLNILDVVPITNTASDFLYLELTLPSGGTTSIISKLDIAEIL